MPRAFVAVLSFMLAACSGGGGASIRADGGAGGDAGGGPVGPDWLDPPAPPALPSLLPCPDGFREVGDGELVTCEPWPEGGRQLCSAGEAHFVGTPGCAPVGTACPAGDFPESLPTDGAVFFVRAGAAAGGDGSQARPFATLAAGVAAARAAATSGPRIAALSKGTHLGNVTVPSGVEVRGACAAETFVTMPSATDYDAAIRVRERGATVRDLTITGSVSVGVTVQDGGELALDGVVIERATTAGLLSVGSTVTARRVVVRATRPHSSGQFGRGVNLEAMATLDATELLVEDNRDIGIQAIGGSTLRLSRAAIRGTRKRALDDRFGIGVSLETGASGTIAATVVEENVFAAVWARPGARVDITDSTLRATIEQDSLGLSGWGLDVGGLDVGALPAMATATRVTIEGNQMSGVQIVNGSIATLEDVVIRDTRPTTFGQGTGVAVDVLFSAALVARRVASARNVHAGVVVVRAGTATVEDLIVEDTTEVDFPAYAVVAENDSSITLARTRLARNHGIGVAIRGGSSALVEDLVVTDPIPSIVTGWARAVDSISDGHVEVRRARIERAVEVGVSSMDRSSILLEDVVVAGTLPRGCSADGCEGLGGSGFVAVTGGSIEARDFTVERSSLCGIQLAREGMIDLHRGIVSNGLFGACADDTAFDIARLMDDVAYVDNGQNLFAETLPVPDPAPFTAGAP